MPEVSVIVPVYKAEQYIKQCIQSLTNQTLVDIEIIMVDDGSPDRSGELCDLLRKADPRIVVHHQRNQGVSVARNAGLDLARGKWVTFVDADDWVEPSLCERAVMRAEETDADIVVFAYYSEYANKSVEAKLVPLPAGDVSGNKDFLELKTISQYYGGNVHNTGVSAGTTWGKMVRRRVLMENGVRFKPGLTRAQDTVFWLYGFEYAKRIVLMEEKLYHYRISETSTCSGTRYLPRCEEPFGMLLEAYQRFIDTFNKDVRFTQALALRTIQVLMWNLKHKLFHPENTETQQKKLAGLRTLVRQEPFRTAIFRVHLRQLPRSLLVMVLFFRAHLVRPYLVVYRLNMKLSQKLVSRFS